MSESKPNVPKLRFPGFTDPWEQRKLGELYEKNTERNVCGFGPNRTLSVATMTFNEEGNGADEASLPSYKVIRVGDVAFEGHTNREFAYGRFVVNAQADGIMSPRFSCLRPKHNYPVLFWKYYLHNECVMRRILVRSTKRGTMMNELVPADLFSQTIPVPCPDEQHAIGAFFRELDNLITLHQRKLDDVKQLKRGMLQKMFPKDGSSVPEVRFPGFTDPWEQRKLGELYEKNTERNVCGFGPNRTLSVATMTFNEEGNGADEASLPSYKVIRVGDVAFEGHTNREFAYGRFVVNAQADGIMSPRFSCLRPKHNYPVLFWKYYLHNECVMRRILVRSTKRGTMMNELVPADLFSQTIPVPCPDEQHAIGAFFRELDDLITLHQRELDHIKLLKKALLQQMFV